MRPSCVKRRRVTAPARLVIELAADALLERQQATSQAFLGKTERFGGEPDAAGARELDECEHLVG